MLVRMQSNATSAAQLKHVSTASRIPGGTTEHTSNVGSNSASAKNMPNILTGQFSSTPAIDTH